MVEVKSPVPLTALRHTLDRLVVRCRGVGQSAEEGQGMVEYALILVLIAIVVIVILAVVGNQVSNVFSNVSGGLNQ
jgi:pilus assembly protein Flp/PilA